MKEQKILVIETKKGRSIDGDFSKNSVKKSTTYKKLLKHLDHIVDNLENKNKVLSSQVESWSVNSPSCSIEEVMSYLEEILEVTVCDELYMLGICLFIKAENRDMFSSTSYFSYSIGLA